MRPYPYRRSYVALLTAGALALWVTALLGADPPSSDPVEALRKALWSPDGSRPTASAPLEKLAAAVTQPGDLRRALLLYEWQGAPGAQQVRAGLAKRLEEQLRGVLKKRNPLRQVAALTLLTGMAVEERKRPDQPVRVFPGGRRPGQPAAQPPSVPPRLAEDVLALLEEPKTEPEVRAAAVRTVTRISPSPGKTLDVLNVLKRSLFARKAEAAERRAAAEGLTYLVQEEVARPHEPVPQQEDVGREHRTKPPDPLKPVNELLTKVIPVAGKALADADPGVRRHCLETIRQGGEAVLRLLPHPQDVRDMALQRGYVPPDLLPVVESLRREVKAVAGQLGARELDVSLAAHRALETLVNARQRQLAISALTAALGDKGDEERGGKEAAKKPVPDPLGRVLQQTVPVLARELPKKDLDIRVRLGSIYVLETLGPEATDAADALAGILNDENVFIRWGGARALGKMAPAGAKRAVDGLSRLLTDDSADVRATAAAALERYGPRAAPAVGALRNVLKGKDAPTRLRAMRVLVAVGTDGRKAVPELREALSDENAQVRAAAAEALARFAPGGLDGETRKALHKALQDPEASVRTAAADALLAKTQ